MTIWRVESAVFCLVVALVGCGREATVQTENKSASQDPSPWKGEAMLTSTAFKQGESIPKRHTGEGGDVSPQLAWSGLPAGVKELALICDDPDAPSRKKPFPKPWVHWVLYNLPADLLELPEGLSRDVELETPAGAKQGLNSWPEGENVGYLGPMPPNGSGPHRYYFKLYALDTKIDLAPEQATKEALLAAMKGHILAEAELMGTYEIK
jgi:Raf kinase inhibitor-like YbhB/YbcL family protein